MPTNATTQPDSTAAATSPIVVDDFSAYFDETPVLRNIDLELRPHERLAIIGPSGSGKTTFLRSLNRLNDLERNFDFTGSIRFNGENIYDASVSVPLLRRKIGMVYAVPTPLPWSIYENLTFGPRMSGRTGRGDLDELVETSLRSAQLWDEVKDRLHMQATDLSGGQQQRLCLRVWTRSRRRRSRTPWPCSSRNIRSSW
jgi:phosphate transport system ATP-binding protein